MSEWRNPTEGKGLTLNRRGEFFFGSEVELGSLPNKHLCLRPTPPSYEFLEKGCTVDVNHRKWGGEAPRKNCSRWGGVG